MATFCLTMSLYGFSDTRAYPPGVADFTSAPHVPLTCWNTWGGVDQFDVGIGADDLFAHTRSADSHYTQRPSRIAEAIGGENMVWSVQPEAVLASAAAESAISAETEAAAAGAAPALLSTTPMGGDPDSAMFSAALNACGASYLGVVAEHASQRGLFAG